MNTQQLQEGWQFSTYRLVHAGSVSSQESTIGASVKSDLSNDSLVYNTGCIVCAHSCNIDQFSCTSFAVMSWCNDPGLTLLCWLVCCRVGLDVFEDEPKMKPGLAECDNAVIVPHIASASLWTRAGMVRTCMHGVTASICSSEPCRPLPHLQTTP